MIGTLLRTSMLAVRRDPIVLTLTFVLPIVFFTVFGLIFGRMSGPSTAAKFKVAVVDDDHTDTSARLVKTMTELGPLEVIAANDRESALHDLRQGKFAVALLIPGGFDAAFCQKGQVAKPLELVYDSANPVARYTVGGLLQGAAHRAAPERLVQRGLEELEPFGGTITAEQKTALAALTPYLRGEKPWDERPGASKDETCTPGAPNQEGVVPLKAIDVRGEQKNVIAYYAAGVAVMFILFSMAGAGGALLGEEESGTLERILNSNATMGTLLTSYFLFFVLLGVLQVTLMFTYAALVFGLELGTLNRIAGFALMTVATASGAAAFGLLLATLCRTRAQLSGISTLVILLMSALGGSMVPRFVMPPIMNTIALFTFNGWALDGYLEVFWYDDPAATLGTAIVAVLPRALVLFGMAGACLLLARRFAKRWESS